MDGVFQGSDRRLQGRSISRSFLDKCPANAFGENLERLRNSRHVIDWNDRAQGRWGKCQALFFERLLVQSGGMSLPAKVRRASGGQHVRFCFQEPEGKCSLEWRSGRVVSKSSAAKANRQQRERGSRRPPPGERFQNPVREQVMVRVPAQKKPLESPEMHACPRACPGFFPLNALPGRNISPATNSQWIYRRILKNR